jgi:ribose transport system substrate-binding protein
MLSSLCGGSEIILAERQCDFFDVTRYIRKDGCFMRNRMFFFFLLFFICSGLILGQTDMKKRKITIGMIGKIGTNPVFIAAYSGACVAAKELGAKYKVEILIDLQTPKLEDVQEQAAAIERLSRSEVSGIAIACSDANYLTPTIDQVSEKGIPVMCFDSDAPKSKRFAYCGADDTEFGKMLMKEIAVVLNGKGVIAVLAGNKNALNQQRRLQALKGELKKYPNITLSPENIYHNLEIPERAVETVTRAQKMNPNIQGWVLLGSWPLLVKNSFNWNPGEIKVVAGNAVQAELEYVKNGYVQSLVGVNCFQMGYKTIESLLNKILNNRNPKESTMYVPLTPVSKENEEEWSLNWRKWLLKEAVNR